MKTSTPSNPQPSLKLTFGLQDGPVKTSAMQTPNGKELAVDEVAYSIGLQNLLERLSQIGLSLKMSRASSAQMKAQRLSQLSTNWKRSGIWGYGFRATFSNRVSPTIVRESSLLDVISPIVYTNSILTAANCLGIIRRERRAGRGGKMDPLFRKSLFQTLRFWFSVAEGSGIPKREATAPRYVPKLDDIREVIPTDQFFVARNLTWEECETLMGFPEGWTVAEGDSLAMQ